MEAEEDLLEQFVGAFGKLAETAEFANIHPVAAELAVGEPNEWGQVIWKPSKVTTARGNLDPVYDKLPARFPPLFERLVLSYRWAEVDLQLYTLLANPPGPDLSRLFGPISKANGYRTRCIQLAISSLQEAAIWTLTRSASTSNLEKEWRLSRCENRSRRDSLQ